MQLKNDQQVPQEVAILISFLMTCIHINFGEIVVVQILRKACQNNHSMPLPVLISQLCDRAEIL